MALAMQPTWGAELLELLEQQRRVYHQLHELSRRQGDLVQAGDAETLLSLLASRQGLIDELARLNERLEPYKRDWGMKWGGVDEMTRHRVHDAIGQVHHLLEAIMKQDDADRAALSRQRGEVAGQLGQVSRGAAMNKAYGRPADGGGAGKLSDLQG